MKYQHILNDVVFFETDDAQEFFSYLINRNDTQAMYSTLYNLLDKSDGYICKMVKS